MANTVVFVANTAWTQIASPDQSILLQNQSPVHVLLLSFSASEPPEDSLSAHVVERGETWSGITFDNTWVRANSGTVKVSLTL
jgi:hypothetical protein